MYFMQIQEDKISGQESMAMVKYVFNKSSL